jgi:hypothetical protein
VIRRKPLSAPTRRDSAGGWGELDYLCKKIHYWLYTRKQKAGAARYRERLEEVLRGLPKNNVAIIRQDGLALLYELKAEFGKAIAHRKREIALMEGLLREAQSPRYSDRTRAFMLEDRTPIDLQGRRAILKALEDAKAQLNGHDARTVVATRFRPSTTSDIRSTP